MSSYQKDNAKRGIKVQDTVDEHNTWLHTNGRLFMFRVPEDIKVVGFAGAMKKGFASGHAYLDFAGMLPDRGGRFVGLEVKSVSESKKEENCAISRNFPFSKLNPKQQLSLARTVRFGGLAAVFVRRIQRSGRITDYLFPVDANGHIAGVSDRKSIRWSDAELFIIPPGQLWLDKLDELMASGFIAQNAKVDA